MAVHAKLLFILPEGGSIFLCDDDGSSLEEVVNVAGMTIDQHRRELQAAAGQYGRSLQRVI